MNRLLSTVSRLVFEDGLLLLQSGWGRGGLEESRAFERGTVCDDEQIHLCLCDNNSTVFNNLRDVLWFVLA